MERTSKQLTPCKKAVILALKGEGLTNRAIARKLDFSEGPVRKFVKRAEAGDAGRKKGSGRPRISNDDEDEVLVDLCLDDRFKSALDLQPEWRDGTGVLVSKSTINRRLVENGLPAFRPRKKPLSKEATKEKRLVFAQRHRRWSKRDWITIIFSDETWFQLFENGGKKFVRRLPGEDFDPDCVIPTIKHPPQDYVLGGHYADNQIEVGVDRRQRRCGQVHRDFAGSEHQKLHPKTSSKRDSHGR